MLQNTIICIKCSRKLDRIDELEEQVKKLQEEMKKLKQEIRSTVSKVASIQPNLHLENLKENTNSETLVEVIYRN